MKIIFRREKIKKEVIFKEMVKIATLYHSQSNDSCKFIELILHIVSEEANSHPHRNTEIAHLESRIK